MKIDSERLLKMLSPTPFERMEQAQRFCFLSEVCFNAEQLEHLTAEGFLECKQIDYGNVPQYVIWFHKTVDRGLHVNAAVQLGNAPIFEALSVALDCIAKEKGCSYIRWTTRRPGLVKKAEQYGYDAQSVLCVKQVKP